MENSTESLEINFEQNLLAQFNEKFAKAKLRLAKCDFDLKIVKQETETRTNKLDKITRTYYTITVNVPEVSKIKKGNETYMGTINIKDGIKQVYNAQSIYEKDILVLSEMELRCDHCNINRKRNAFFVFKRNSDNAIRMYARNCTKKYFGYDVAQMLRVWEKELATLSDEGRYKSVFDGYYVSEIINSILFVQSTSGKKYWKGQHDEEKEYDGIRDLYYFPMRLNRWGSNDHGRSTYERDALLEYRQWLGSDLDVELRDSIVEKFYKFGETLEPTNDFEHNIKNVIVSSTGERINVWRKIGLVAWKLFDIAFPREIKKKTKKERLSEYVGSPKERMDLELTPVFLKMWEGNYGWTTLIMFVDKKGNKFTWFASGDKTKEYEKDQSYKVKATIKKHEIYNKEKINYINRVKTIA